MCSDSLTVAEHSNEQSDSDLRITLQDILLANKITNQNELDIALNRVKQLWGALQFSKAGDELEQLADLIIEYQDKILIEDRKTQSEVEVKINDL